MKYALHLCVLCAMAGFCGSAEAVHKCVDAKGTITYSGTPCPPTDVEKTLDATPRAAGANRGGQDVDEIMRNSQIGPDARQSALAARVLASKKIGEPSTQQVASCFQRYRGTLADPTAAFVVASGVYAQPEGDTFIALDVSARNGGGGEDRVWFLCGLPK